jgi:L-threonylcarbamoyladenylate synthase
MNIILEKGSVIVMPTDTVYGLVCSAKDKLAVAKLYEIKSRSSKPGTIVAASVDQLVELGIKRRYLTAVEHLWPSPISVIIPSEPEHRYLDLGSGTLAMRVTSDKKLAEILKNTGPLLTSSANLPGEQPATSIEQARRYFGSRVDEYFDGGNLSERKPSTIVRVVDDAVEVLRQGSVIINEKGEVVK